MTYSAPELRLVGAAQNLVLANSFTPDKVDIQCSLPQDEEIEPNLYDSLVGW